MRIVVYTHDPILTLAWSKEETLELFGQEYFDEYSIEVPDELGKNIIETYKKLKGLSAQLDYINRKGAL